MALSKEIGDRIDALIPPSERKAYRYGWWAVMDGPYWYLSGITPVSWRSVLADLDRWGVDTSEVRAAIEAELSAAGIGAGI